MKPARLGRAKITGNGGSRQKKWKKKKKSNRLRSARNVTQGQGGENGGSRVISRKCAALRSLSRVGTIGDNTEIVKNLDCSNREEPLRGNRE